MKKWMLSVCAVILSLSLAGSASAYCASGSQVQSNVRTYTVYGAGQPGSLPASGDLSDLVRGILNGTQSAACPATGETDSETASACPEASAEQNCANPSGQNTDALPAAADTENPPV